MCGGKQVDRPGLYFEPTIFTHVDDHNYIAVEESFGPVMIISEFCDRWAFLVYLTLDALQ